MDMLDILEMVVSRDNTNNTQQKRDSAMFRKAVEHLTFEIFAPQREPSFNFF